MENNFIIKFSVRRDDWQILITPHNTAKSLHYIIMKRNLFYLHVLLGTEIDNTDKILEQNLHTSYGLRYTVSKDHLLFIKTTFTLKIPQKFIL